MFVNGIPFHLEQMTHITHASQVKTKHVFIISYKPWLPTQHTSIHKQCNKVCYHNMEVKLNLEKPF